MHKSTTFFLVRVRQLEFYSIYGLNLWHLVKVFFFIGTGRRSEVDLRRQNHGRQRPDLHVQHRREEVRRRHGEQIRQWRHDHILLN